VPSPVEIREGPRLTSHVVDQGNSTRGVFDAAERGIATSNNVPTIDPVTAQNRASRANASQIA
jgi:hypothetical protein